MSEQHPHTYYYVELPLRPIRPFFPDSLGDDLLPHLERSDEVSVLLAQEAFLCRTVTREICSHERDLLAMQHKFRLERARIVAKAATDAAFYGFVVSPMIVWLFTQVIHFGAR